MRKVLTCVLAAVVVSMLAVMVAAAPADQLPYELMQPDGTPIVLIGFGDEFYSFQETDGGYTVVLAEDGWYHYADVNEEGRFEVTTARVGLESPLPLGLTTHLREEATIVRSTKTFNGYIPFSGGPEVAAPPAAAKTPLLLIDFPDNASTQSVGSFDDMMNQANYNGTGSFKEYYMDNSYGAHNVTGESFGWYEAAENRDYYRHSHGDHSERYKQLVRNAVDQAEAAGVDFSQYDADGNGVCDGIFVVHQGPGAEEGSQTQFIWSHRSRLSNYGLQVTYDGVLIDDYAMMPEIVGGGHAQIGVYCHEYGHVVGLPDLYDTDASNGDSEGIGHWGIMGSGGWNTPAIPAHFCCYFKSLLGWITPTVVGGWSPGMVIPQVETNPFALKVWNGGAPGTEFFMIENRQPTGFDLNLHGCGLVIYHIDETVGGNQDENHKWVDVEAADGLTEMDDNVNRGNNGDIFPGSTDNRNFLFGTNPNSRAYSGTNTNVEVRDISDCGTFMTADVDVLPYPASASVWGTVSRAGSPMVATTVRLLNSSHNFVVSTTTDIVGQYFFASVNNGDYFIEPVLDVGWVSLDGEEIPVTVHGHTEIVDVPVAQIKWDNFQPTHLSTIEDFLPLVSSHISVLGGPPTVFKPSTIEMVFNGAAVSHDYAPGTQIVSYQETDTLPNGSYTAHVDVDDMYDNPGPHASWTFEVLVPYGNVQGHVTCGGDGIGGVSIDLYNAGGWVATTLTEPDGYYRYDHMNVDNGDYHVQIQVPECFGPATDTVVDVTVFGWPDAVADFELWEIYATNLMPVPGSTVDTCQTTISAELNVKGGPISVIDTSTIVLTLNGVVMHHEYDASTHVVSYFTDPPLPNEDYVVTLDVSDRKGYPACQEEWEFTIYQPYGDVKGSVTDNGNGGTGLLGVPIALLDNMGDTLRQTTTEADGSYFFGHVMNGDYFVGIPLMPLGYVPEFADILPIVVNGWPPAEAHFPLDRDPGPENCDETSNYFWAWQAYGACQNYGGLKYTRDDMVCFGGKIVAHFNHHFDHFVDIHSVHDQFCILFHFWMSTEREEALSHFYALLLNTVSERINTYDIVSQDGATVSQAILYISQLLDTGDPYDTKLALGLARAVNWEWCILPPGWIPLSTPHIAFKPTDEVTTLPTVFALSQNYPNPFNPVTDIHFALPKSCDVDLTIYNTLGQRVTTLIDGNLSAGEHVFQWDAGDYATGVYFYRLTTDDFVDTKKMVLMK